jgi:hypothetical protein
MDNSIYIARINKIVYYNKTGRSPPRKELWMELLASISLFVINGI